MKWNAVPIVTRSNRPSAGSSARTRGTWRHAIPVTNTSASALNATRAGTGRYPWGPGRLTGWINSSATSHNPSRISNTVAITALDPEQLSPTPNPEVLAWQRQRHERSRGCEFVEARLGRHGRCRSRGVVARGDARTPELSPRPIPAHEAATTNRSSFRSSCSSGHEDASDERPTEPASAADGRSQGLSRPCRRSSRDTSPAARKALRQGRRARRSPSAGSRCGGRRRRRARNPMIAARSNPSSSMRAAMSSAIDSKRIDRSAAGQRPCDCRSTATTQRCSARSGMFGPNIPAEPKPPCKSTTGATSPTT